MSDAVKVGLRDASWYNRPNVWSPKRYHRVVGDESACTAGSTRRDPIPISEFTIVGSDQVDPWQLCGNCFRNPREGAS